MRLRREERILFWGSNLWYFGEGMFGPLFAVFAQRVGGNVLDITWAWTVFLVVTGLTIIVVGKISDKLARRRGREKIMLAGYALNAVFTFGYLFVETPLQLMLVQAGLGFAAALAIPTWLALYDENSRKRDDGFLWGLSSGFDRLFTAAGILIGGYIVTYASFTALFVTMGCIQVVATLYQARILSRTRT